ncbi:VOC family protein [Streptomyces sp. NA04227]|uniref:VOC family protein n=1 Tax=Streptomyces sp. NA04227 TaxID=2742136 RepID=UPI0015904585|nr:VOC family protein [Streptomyces sp. NA04227]QKW10204.1 VOC family protein [Streptomyces sp. NA04227]
MSTTNYLTGAPNWIDLGTPDLDAARAFYGELFGWEFQSAGPEAGGYGLFRTEGGTVAGAMTVTAEQGPPAWSVYFQTPDADATVSAARDNKGQVSLQPMDVMDQGRMAMASDVFGADFGLWQPRANKGMDVTMEVNSLCWVELYTRDVPEATGFYRSVLGWKSEDTTFPGGVYTMVRPAEGDEGSAFGGVAELATDPSEKDSDPHWLIYFEVQDPDAFCARAEELGGTVRMAPVDLDEVGRFAKLTDPQGARFAIIKPVPQQG